MTPDVSTILNQYIATEILKQPGRILSTEDKLISNGLVDSFHLVDLALFIEETFGVHIDDTELTADTFDTLAQLITLIEQRQ